MPIYSILKAKAQNGNGGYFSDGNIAHRNVIKGVFVAMLSVTVLYDSNGNSSRNVFIGARLSPGFH